MACSLKVYNDKHAPEKCSVYVRTAAERSRIDLICARNLEIKSNILKLINKNFADAMPMLCAHACIAEIMCLHK